jgi:hypothetical protein
LTPLSADGQQRPDPDPPDPAGESGLDNERRESSDDEAGLDQAPMQGENPNLAGPSLLVPSPRAMTTQGTDLAVGKSTDIRSGSDSELRSRREEKGKAVERGETAGKGPGRVPALELSKQERKWGRARSSLLKELSEEMIQLQTEFGEADKRLQSLEEGAERLQKQAQQQRRLQERLQGTLDGRIGRLRQLVDAIEEEDDSDDDEIEEIVVPLDRGKRRASTETLQAEPSRKQGPSGPGRAEFEVQQGHLFGETFNAPKLDTELNTPYTGGGRTPGRSITANTRGSTPSSSEQYQNTVLLKYISMIND